jgi:hypothetical protein
MTTGPPSWRMTAPPSVDGDAVEAALRPAAAKLGCGPLGFEFARSRSPCGDVALTPRLDGAADVVEPASLLAHNEQLVPRAPRSLPAEARASLETPCLEALGRGFFEDVARLVRTEMEFR